MKAYAVIVAGGVGKRMGADKPKQLLELCGIPIIELTLRPFLDSREIEGIVISSATGIIDEITKIIEKIAPSKPVEIVIGGKERQESVIKGINALPDDTDVVLIHDAVRPFIDKELVDKCTKEAFKKGAVVVMKPIHETLKTIENEEITGTIDRSKIRAAQTPQAFRYEIIMEAHQKALEDNFLGTDDSMLVERLGLKVYLIEGSEKNIKITTPSDLIIAEAFMNNR